MKQIICLIAISLVMALGAPVRCEAGVVKGGRGASKLLEKSGSGGKAARHQKKKDRKRLKKHLRKQLRKQQRKQG